MPSGRTPHAVAVNLRRLADDCGAFTDEVVDTALPAVGMAMKRIALDEAARVAGGDRRLSGFKRGRGVKLDAGYDRTGPGVVTLTPRPIGPWTLVESGSKRSTWWEPRAPKRRRDGPRTGRRLRLRNGGVRWYVRHGPVRGKQAWSRVLARIDDALPAIVADAVVEAWATVRKGA